MILFHFSIYCLIYIVRGKLVRLCKLKPMKASNNTRQIRNRKINFKKNSKHWSTLLKYKSFFHCILYYFHGDKGTFPLQFVCISQTRIIYAECVSMQTVWLEWLSIPSSNCTLKHTNVVDTHYYMNKQQILVYRYVGKQNELLHSTTMYVTCYCNSSQT